MVILKLIFLFIIIIIIILIYFLTIAICCFQGKGDQTCQFIVEKYKDKGYVALQSASQRGIYIGLTPEGALRPTVNTGVKNIWLYPEVVECKYFFIIFLDCAFLLTVMSSSELFF